MFAETAVAEALDEELTATKDFEELLIVVVEEVEATVVVLTLLDGVGDLRQRPQARRGIVDGGEKVDVAVVGSREMDARSRQRE